ncbi:MAG: TIGR04211 family SH3 domain-containing protein [Gammaproteobacteria bacterium]|nr:TIGR04211 family SH3 domain-containing protein [Gammaproteobacteria bacterium]MCP5195340.1 TIGR04211 family SH3 domain-containing protein [Gammaproteobacteria bacterium]
MKTTITSLVLTLLLFVVMPVQAETPALSQDPVATHVSDSVEIPLRAGASNRYKVIGSVRSGSPIEVLKVDKAKGYTQIRTSVGGRGWIRSDQLTDTPSSQEQLISVRQELERLQAKHADLKQHMDEIVDRPSGESLSYPQLYEEALRLRQQLAQYRKVASDTVAIDERNKTLQERTVMLERELQIVQQENQALRNDNDSIRFLVGGVLLGAALLISVLMPRIREQRRAQWSRL